MDTEPTQVPTSTMPASDKPQKAKVAEPVFASPWEAYLFGKKVSAAGFLAKMAKDATAVLDEATRNRIATAFTDKPEQLERLRMLLQVSARSTPSIRRILIELAEIGFRCIEGFAFPEQPDATFGQAVLSWLGSIRERPLKHADLNKLFLLLHVGVYRQWLDQDTALGLITTALSKPTPPQTVQTQAAKTVPTPLELLLASDPTAASLIPLLAYFDAVKAEAGRQRDQILAQAKHIELRTTQRASLITTVDELRAEIATLTEQKDAATAKAADLEKQLESTRATYQHKIDDLRGRTRGLLQGEIARWLQTSLDAARANPPRISVVEERLEEALKRIEKGIQ